MAQWPAPQNMRAVGPRLREDDVESGQHDPGKGVTAR
ncbi:hypothetical protein SAMN05428948_0804 [Massilia sp. CF038]|nr:hypothetical protein SAMN05428948_0804 [Massilia sp. CF038]